MAPVAVALRSPTDHRDRADPMTRTGYLSGIFDLFHIGHLDILNNALAHCDLLFVGVITDDVVLSRWGVPPFVPLEERLEILCNVRGIVATAEAAPDLRTAWERVGSDIVFVGARRGLHSSVDLMSAFDGSSVCLIHLPPGRDTQSAILRTALDRAPRTSVA